MHFVGNRAIVLGDGEEQIQLYYNSSFTAVSAVLPIVVIFLGFLVADRFHQGNKNSTTRYAALTLCGMLSGAAVTEMHYLGNQGTTNYRLVPRWKFVVGAALIAVCACVVSFSLFFHWSRHWMNNIWRRFLVACALAIAVSGMHWTGAAGTSYELRGYHTGPGKARNINLIIAICLCLSACSVCFALGYLKQRHQRKLKDRAQQVVLAVATFDGSGRILVTQSGLLPCQTITSRFNRRMFDEDFSTSHPVFQWIFRVSRNWGGIVDLIPAMRDHLTATGDLHAHQVMRSSSLAESTDSDDISDGYSLTFRQLFCVAAHDIAKSLDTRLQDLGSLYEDILTTGTLLTRPFLGGTQGTKTNLSDTAPPKDIEAKAESPILFGTGQLLVLTREVAVEESNRLQNAGYRFAHLDQISDPLARSMQIPRDDLHRLVGRLQSFCARPKWIPARGTYLASFLLQPSPVMKGLDIVVPRNQPECLPMVKLSSSELDRKALKLLSTLEGLTLDECMERIEHLIETSSEDNIWLEKFNRRIQGLLDLVNEPSLHRATFSCRQLDITHGVTGHNESTTATVFAFCGIKEVYKQSLQSKDMRYVPLSFFQCYQRTYPGCPDHAIFAQKNHKEFSALYTTLEPELPSTSSNSTKKWPMLLSFKRSPSRSELGPSPDSSSEKGLVRIKCSTPTDLASSVSNHPFGGGIMVGRDITIEDNKNGYEMELGDLGIRSEATVADKEQQTLADKLMSLTGTFHGRR